MRYADVAVFYLFNWVLFFPPPQPPLCRTGLSRNEMRSFRDGAELTLLGDGTSVSVKTKNNISIYIINGWKRILSANWTCMPAIVPWLTSSMDLKLSPSRDSWSLSICYGPSELSIPQWVKHSSFQRENKASFFLCLMRSTCKSLCRTRKGEIRSKTERQENLNRLPCNKCNLQI